MYLLISNLQIFIILFVGLSIFNGCSAKKCKDLNQISLQLGENNISIQNYIGNCNVKNNGITNCVLDDGNNRLKCKIKNELECGTITKGNCKIIIKSK